MKALKRGRQQFEHSEDDTLIIRVSDDQTLVAQASLVRICSFCASGLPAEAAEWDLRLLQIDGQSVDLETVIGWLNCVYDRLQDDQFMQQDHDVRHTVAGLTRLLAFADAVGTTRGVMAACITQLTELHMTVELPHQPDPVNIRLETDGRVYCFMEEEDDAGNYDCDRLVSAVPFADWWPLGADTCTSRQQERVFKQRVAQQVEPLLHLAHKLELQPLIRHLHTFISSSTIKGEGILWGVLAGVFTDRVLSVVVSERASEEAKRAWIDSVLTTRCGCSPVLGSLLKPVPSSKMPLMVHFDAQLCAPLLGSNVGDRVQVRLDLFDNSTIRIGCLEVPVVLQIGHSLGDRHPASLGEAHQPCDSMIMSYDMPAVQEPDSPTRSESEDAA